VRVILFQFDFFDQDKAVFGEYRPFIKFEQKFFRSMNPNLQLTIPEFDFFARECLLCAIESSFMKNFYFGEIVLSWSKNLNSNIRTLFLVVSSISLYARTLWTLRRQKVLKWNSHKYVGENKIRFSLTHTKTHIKRALRSKWAQVVDMDLSLTEF